MGQILACCTVAEKEANDDTTYPGPQADSEIIGENYPQEIEQVGGTTIWLVQNRVPRVSAKKIQC